MLLHDEIEQSFGTGPEHRPIEQQIEAGRRALRRRRMVAAMAGVGVVAVIGTTYAVVSPDSEGRATGVAAVDPTTTPSPTLDTAVPWDDDTPLRYLDGDLQIHPGVVVHEHIDNPYGHEPPDLSDALDITFDGRRTWMIVELKNGSFSSVASVPMDDAS